MRAIALAFLLVAFTAAFSYGDPIKPVRAWPKTLDVNGAMFPNPPVAMCVKEGYRLIPKDKPATPAGKRIKSEAFVQDEVAPEMCAYEIVYEDLPVKPIPPAPTPEVLTNIAPEKCLFVFTTNGAFKGAVWLDGPVTNVVE